MKRMDPCAFLLSTDARTGQVSGMAVTWMNRCDKTSWMVSVSQSSHTLELIRSSREFVLALASTTQADELTYFGSTKGASASVNKLRDTGIHTEQFENTYIRTPMVVDAYRNIACKVGGIMPVSADYAIVYGTVVGQYDNPQAEQLFYCGKDEYGRRRYATQHEYSAQPLQIDDIVPTTLLAPFVTSRRAAL